MSTIPFQKTEDRRQKLENRSERISQVNFIFGSVNFKRTSILLLLFSLQHILVAQTDWKLGGNVVGADSKLGTNSGYDLIIETNNLERMRLTDAGNLGIGLNNPSSKLHLVGDFKLEGTLHIPSWTDLNDQDVRLIQLDPNGIFQPLQSNSLTSALYKYDCVQDSNDPFPIPVWKSYANGGDGILHTGVSCPAKVGIGIATPAHDLHVHGTTLIKQKLFLGSDPEIDGMIVIESDMSEGLVILPRLHPDATAIQLLDHNDYAQNIFRLNGQGEIQMNYFGLNDPFAIGREAGTNDIFRIRTDGGIDMGFNDTFDPLTIHNRTTESQVFKVRYDGSIYSNYSGNFEPFTIHDFVQNMELFQVRTDGSVHINHHSVYDPISIRNSTLDANIFRIGSDGGIDMNCGVGVSPFAIRKAQTSENLFRVTPDGALDLFMHGATSPLTLQRGSTSEKIMEVSNGGDLHLYYTENFEVPLSIRESGDNTLMFEVGKSGGLHAHYSGNTENPFSIQRAGSGDNMYVYKPDGGINMKFDRAQNGSVLFVADKATNEDIFAITGDGKVWCQGVVVKHAPFWGDFVFEETYERKSLYEVEKYLIEHKHMPDFPTADCIEEEGADVYELVRLLTIKVEELTLYSIDQQKEIDQLKKEISNTK
jgi:hypothetical protein